MLLCLYYFGAQEQLDETLLKWTEYSSHLADCDSFIQQKVGPWLEERIPSESMNDAQAQLDEAKVTFNIGCKAFHLLSKCNALISVKVSESGGVAEHRRPRPRFRCFGCTQ